MTLFGRRARRAVPVVAALALLVTGVPGTASAETAAQARAQADGLSAELTGLRTLSAEAIHRLEQAEHQLGLAVGRSATLARELEAARELAGGSDRQLSRRVSALYRSGGSLGVWASLLQARDPSDFAARTANVHKVVATDAQLRDEAQVDAGRVAELEELARQATADQIRLTGLEQSRTAELTAYLEQQEVAYARASARVRELVEAERRAAAAAAAAKLLAVQQAREAAARAAAASGTTLRPGAGSDPAASSDPYVGPPGACPVGAVHSFTDTWHAPRSGGRQHMGTDVFAPWGSPAYAVVDGVIDRWSNSGLGGLAVWLQGDDGTRYYYAHNSRNVAHPGQRVRAGEVIAYVGNTGNAATTPSHIHFEARPPHAGGTSLNPYPWLAALCGH